MNKVRIVGALLILLTVPAFLIPLYYGWVTDVVDLATQVTALVIGTLLTSGVVLLFKDMIFGKKRPELTIPFTELKSTGEVKELEVRFPNAKRRNRVCFYYVTVMAKSEKTIENVYASLDGNQLRIVPRTEKSSFGIDYDRLSVEEFDKAGPREFVYALLNEEKKTKDKIEYVHPSQRQDFVLFYGVEGLMGFYIPTITYFPYNPRTGPCGLQRDDGTGTLKLKLDLSGQDAKGCSMMFEVAFRKWDSFTVTPIELPQ